MAMFNRYLKLPEGIIRFCDVDLPMRGASFEGFTFCSIVESVSVWGDQEYGKSDSLGSFDHLEIHLYTVLKIS